ncbi:MAG TPA: recombinase family protein, partial [Syntrophorhabdaceae bacterium]|nr:recombinase family protein [Syntrophorhabdaceae bacterium]
MRAAIYTRYSSENQSEKSIEDQIRVCKKHIVEQGMALEDRHIFTDEAVSGSLANRPGLQALEKAVGQKEIDVVVVDDLSRLSRNNHQMLTVVLTFSYHQIKIISIADGIQSDDDNSKLSIHIRVFINELYLDDLKKKTMRGLEGQKLRGFSAGENVYGYYTQPQGELKLTRRGKQRYDGMVHKVHPEEADVVRSIYRQFVEGRSLAKIADSLNIDKVPTKRGLPGGWNVSTLSRILKNEKYIGEWVWRKQKIVRDPLSGKIRTVPRPENEHIKSFREDLVIIDQETWEKAQNRWKAIDKTWPIRKHEKERLSQRSYIHATPTYLFSGLMQCTLCDGPIVLLSGKGSGYYGCYNSRRHKCTNHLLVPRKRLETTILQELQNTILTPENIEYVYENVEHAARKELNDVPELIRKKKTQCERIQSEIHNYLSYIKRGNFSKAVSEALQQAETQSESLTEELRSLEYQKTQAFTAPPHEWVVHRLENLQEALNQNTPLSAEALKGLLGSIYLEPKLKQDPDICQIGEFKPYYIAHTKITTLALLDEAHKGSNWYQWRRG